MDVSSQDSSAFGPIKWGDFRLAYLRPSGDGPQLDLVQKTLSSFSDTKKWIFPKQVHGTDVIRVDAQCQPLQEADAMICQDADLGLAVFGGDCPGLIVDAGDVWGIAHCGWRGVARGIVGKLFEQLTASSKKPLEQWGAFVGPGICGECYEVDQPVLDAFSWCTEALVWEKEGKAGLDLKNEISHQLRCLGIQQHQIWKDPCCTFENSNLHSFRRSGVGQNQLLSVFRFY